jgi:hypothetical protein
MSRLSVTLILTLCLTVYSGIAFAQEGEMAAEVHEGIGTLRGSIVDTTTQENPIPDVQVKIRATDGSIIETTSDSSGEWVATDIPPGRYLVSIYAKGYGSREGKRVTVLPGGDQELRLKMTKEDSIITFFQKLGFAFWPFALGFITAVPIAFITGFLIATKLLKRRGV